MKKENYSKIFMILCALNITCLLISNIITIKTIIPITKNGEIIDGAHRLAIALYFNLKVPFVMFDLLDANYNKQFFINRGFNEKYAKIIDKEIVEKNNYNIDLEGIKK